MTRGERSLLQDIKAHEIAHRTFFARTLGGNRIPDLTPNFSAVDFSSSASVLGTAATFEDLGVAAYNGGGAAIQSPKILAAAGSIVSVEARHAATIHTIIGDAGPVDRERARQGAAALAGAADGRALHRDARHRLAASLIPSPRSPTMSHDIAILDGIDPDLSHRLTSDATSSPAQPSSSAPSRPPP